MLFDLIAGQHVQADKSQPKDKRTGKHPSRVFNAPAVVESDVDLEAKFGSEKFRRRVEQFPAKE